MSSFRTGIASMIASVCVFAAVLAEAQTLPPAPAASRAVPGFSRCSTTVGRYNEMFKQLNTFAAHVRALADENPLLEPDAAFYEAELALTKKCAGSSGGREPL